MSITIVLADDHQLFRAGLKSLLEADGAFIVSATAADGIEAVRLVRDLKPDVAILDIGMPQLNGIEATRKIMALKQGTRVIALSMHQDLRYVSEIMAAGARGYLLKDCAVDELCDAIRVVMAGSVAVSRPLSDVMILGFVEGNQAPSSLAPLNPREREIHQLLIEGKKRREIAELLHISVKTVETHRKNLMAKLHVTSVAELIRLTMKDHIPLS